MPQKKDLKTMNKKEIKKITKEKPSDEQVKETTLALSLEEEPEYLDLLLKKRPRVGRAVQLFLAGNHTRGEIASILDVTSATVGKWLRDPDIKKYMEEFQKQEANIIRCRMQASSVAALDKMVDLLDSPIDGVALQAAKDLMDRAGFKPKQEIKKEVTVKTFEQQLLDVLGDEVLDVEYEDVDGDIDDNEEDDE